MTPRQASRSMAGRRETEMASAAASPKAVEIPNKLYFRIGDVARITGIKPFVLRYWETEFPSLSPKKSGTNQRLYRRPEVELVLAIKHLLYEKRFTIEGARACLKEGRAAAQRMAAAAAAASAEQKALFSAAGPDVGRLKAELESVLDLLA